MAIAGVASWQIEDASGTVGSLEVPFVNSTTVLADIITWITTNMTPAIDVITDGKIRKVRLSLVVTLPGGLKANPVANCDAERSGLFSMVATGTPNGYAVVVPALKSAAYSGDDVNDAQADIAAFETLLTTAVSNTRPTDKYGNVLESVSTSRKTFRKRK
jgi:hypothetical protein